MILKNDAGRTYLYRSRWVPKGPGVPHGYSTQEYVGAVGSDVESLPETLADVLTPEERQQLEDRLFTPRRRAREAAERRTASRQVDPRWRLEEALRLVREAAELSERRPVEAASTARLIEALRSVRTPAPISAGEPASQHPLVPALRAIRTATQAVRSGELGRAPD